MEEVLFHPILWTVIAVILVSAIVASIIIGGKRSKEVKELDKMFPEGKLASQNLEKIPVEKVRRSTIERERRKKEREKELPKRVRPKEGEKVFAEEDQEFILHSLHHQSSTNAKENDNQKPLKPRPHASDRTNVKNTNPNPSFDQGQETTNETLSSPKEKIKTQTTNSQRLRTQLRPSDQISVTDTQDDQVISSELKPFARSNRMSQSKNSQSNDSNKQFPPRSRRSKQASTAGQENLSDSNQSFQSRSSKYSIKKRFF